ncbi:hypothetical protein GCM10011584_09750 [Nocardioides phosphati]|uniref:Uncharacterized protein n=1 Tax=Nocardioides phosphati TaxID=1867775 RepID=A0ABQ2N8N2_9ACTN|nr:hypothetical protein GCM10011584_09750 [Nocardioides phosphati]
MIRATARFDWSAWLIGVYVDADYTDLIDVMIGFGPFWVIFTYTKKVQRP